MLVRAILAAAIAASLSLTAGSAHASCLDDATARNLAEGYTPAGEPSPYFASLSYVQVTGTATVTIHGDALVSDTLFGTGEWVRWAGIVGDNTADITTTFVDCVAG